MEASVLLNRQPSTVLSCLVSTFWDICDGCEWMQEGGPEDVACTALQASKTQDQINHADAPGLLHEDND